MTAAVGTRLRELRRARGWSIETAAPKLGLTPAALGSYERSTRELSIDRAAKLAASYGVDVAELFGEQPCGKRPRVVLNLATLAEGAQTNIYLRAVDRWVQAIREQRGDWAGQVLSIRHGDLNTIALIVGMWEADEPLAWLDSAGVLADGSARP